MLHNSQIFDSIFVTTDNKKIAQIAKNYGAEVPFLRKKQFAEDDTTTEATLKNALNEYEKFKNTKFDICVFMTPTDIFRKNEDIKKVVNYLINDKKLESCFSVRPTHKNYWHYDSSKKIKRILNSMKKYSSRQLKSPIYREDTGLVCASRANLWRKGKRIGDNVKIIVNDNPIDIDVHDAYDLYLVRKTFSYFKKRNPKHLPKIN